MDDSRPGGAAATAGAEATDSADRLRLERRSPFSYACQACSRCCHDIRIQLNPFEIARLARDRELTTTEFLARYVEPDVPHLRRTEDAACVFLTGEGCGVHRARPLVCRLYPLGRHIDSSGAEHFSVMRPHPGSEGVFGRSGTVAHFLAAQEAGPYLAAADRYLALFDRLWDALQDELGAEAEDDAPVGPDESEPLPEWLDMDAAIARHERESGEEAPTDPRARMELHIEIMERWLEDVAARREA